MGHNQQRRDCQKIVRIWHLSRQQTYHLCSAPLLSSKAGAPLSATYSPWSLYSPVTEAHASADRLTFASFTTKVVFGPVTNTDATSHGIIGATFVTALLCHSFHFRPATGSGATSHGIIRVIVVATVLFATHPPRADVVRVSFLVASLGLHPVSFADSSL